jgi:hypothetical protein
VSLLDVDRVVSVSVVICAYTHAWWNTPVTAVLSAQLQDPATTEVILVIGHNESSLARVRLQTPWVKATVNTRRSGLSGTRNSEVAAATGNVVALLDAAAEEGWLAHVVEVYQAGSVLGLGGLVTPLRTTERPRWSPSEFGCSFHEMPETTAAVRNVIGTNMSFRSDPLGASRGFASELGRVEGEASGCEETELCIRMTGQEGGRLSYEPVARVAYQVPPTWTTWGYFVRRCYQEGCSKVDVARVAGPNQALQTEWSHLRGVIPRRVARCLTPTRRVPVGVTMGVAVLVAGGLDHSAVLAHGHLPSLKRRCADVTTRR